jgi:uncharacterized protein YdeI (YjbR/CyaY-like superfamily)
MDPAVDAYIESSGKWSQEMAALRRILIDAGLNEQIKWRTPCFSHRGKNIVIFQEMNEFLALMFFKGALLVDPAGVLRDQGPNSRSARRLEFTSVEHVADLAATVTEYVTEAIGIEEAGLAVGPPPELVLVEELASRLDADPELKAAFESLTAGRRREYNMHIGSAKKSETRTARVEKYLARIRAGKGLRDR